MPKLPDNLDDLFFRFRYVILIFLLGAILTGVGLFISQNERNGDGDRVEVLTGATEGQNEGSEIVVEIAGEVERPGVYKLPKNSRIGDLLVAAGGVSPNADRDWMEKSLNRAARLADGTKIYIPAVNERSGVLSANNLGVAGGSDAVRGSGGSDLININLASQKELETLPGIGPVYAQNIIEHRPYSNLEELVSKGAISQKVFDKIKNDITN